MDFRGEHKVTNAFNQKSISMLRLRERVGRRVNPDYTHHLIKSGNAQQREINETCARGSVVEFDNRATSTAGLLTHLNSKLADLTAKKNKSLLEVRNEYHASIKKQTHPIHYLKLVTGTEPEEKKIKSPAYIDVPDSGVAVEFTSASEIRVFAQNRSQLRQHQASIASIIVNRPDASFRSSVLIQDSVQTGFKSQRKYRPFQLNQDKTELAEELLEAHYTAEDVIKPIDRRRKSPELRRYLLNLVPEEETKEEIFKDCVNPTMLYYLTQATFDETFTQQQRIAQVLHNAAYPTQDEGQLQRVELIKIKQEKFSKFLKRDTLHRSHTTFAGDRSTDASYMAQAYRSKSDQMVEQDIFEINKRVSKAFTKDNLSVKATVSRLENQRVSQESISCLIDIEEEETRVQSAYQNLKGSLVTMGEVAENNPQQSAYLGGNVSPHLPICQNPENQTPLKCNQYTEELLQVLDNSPGLKREKLSIPLQTTPIFEVSDEEIDNIRQTEPEHEFLQTGHFNDGQKVDDRFIKVAGRDSTLILIHETENEVKRRSMNSCPGQANSDYSETSPKSNVGHKRPAWDRFQNTSRQLSTSNWMQNSTPENNSDASMQQPFSQFDSRISNSVNCSKSNLSWPKTIPFQNKYASRRFKDTNIYFDPRSEPPQSNEKSFPQLQPYQVEVTKSLATANTSNKNIRVVQFADVSSVNLKQSQMIEEEKKQSQTKRPKARRTNSESTSGFVKFFKGIFKKGK